MSNGVLGPFDLARHGRAPRRHRRDVARRRGPSTLVSRRMRDSPVAVHAGSTTAPPKWTRRAAAADGAAEDRFEPAARRGAPKGVGLCTGDRVHRMGMTRSSSSSLRRDGARGRAGAGGGPASRAAAVQPLSLTRRGGGGAGASSSARGGGGGGADVGAGGSRGGSRRVWADARGLARRRGSRPRRPRLYRFSDRAPRASAAPSPRAAAAA